MLSHRRFHKTEKDAAGIVVDTNLLVAAFFNKRSASFKILRMAEEKKIQIFWTESIKREAEIILTNIQKSLKSSGRKKVLAEQLEAFEKEVFNKIFKQENKIKNPPRVNAVKEDPSDNKFLSCALAANVDLITTTDRHLLKLRSFRQIPILTPTASLIVLP